MPNKLRFIFIYVFISLFFPAIISCKKKADEIPAQIPEPPPQIVEIPMDFWYAFSFNKEGVPCVKIINTVYSLEDQPFFPWTESLRVSGIGLMYPSAKILINHAGIIDSRELLAGESFQMPIQNYFLHHTVSGFYTSEQDAFIRIYKNTVFSPLLQNDVGESPFLCKVSESAELTPAFFPSSIGLSKNAQCVSLQKRKDSWYASFKTETKTQVQFTYLVFKSFNDLANGKFSTVSAEAFRSALMPIRHSAIAADEEESRILHLINKASEQNLRVMAFTPSWPSERVYEKKERGNDTEDFSEREAVASVFAQPFHGITAGLLVNNGSFYFLSEGTEEVKKIELLPLPENFVYTYFTCCNDKIIAAWEEQNFYAVGRSGIAVLDIQKHCFGNE
ncbi:hypothetical protein [Treponema phagedenis]|uniref:hypothetical protein n=3 Tax=Treponema phagedenis TaxID=162 RepID=UPI001583DB2F|nr:hypothetical protein [Treponema phagedenis]QKS92651.1 hypothetical protein HPJ96_08905 [Treponema phagedenis]